jgi:hypothetical protein
LKQSKVALDKGSRFALALVIGRLGHQRAHHMPIDPPGAQTFCNRVKYG